MKGESRAGCRAVLGRSDGIVIRLRSCIVLRICLRRDGTEEVIYSPVLTVFVYPLCPYLRCNQDPPTDPAHSSRTSPDNQKSPKRILLRITPRNEAFQQQRETSFGIILGRRVSLPALRLLILSSGGMSVERHFQISIALSVMCSVSLVSPNRLHLRVHVLKFFS